MELQKIIINVINSRYLFNIETFLIKLFYFLSFLFLIKFQEIKNYFYPLAKFTKEEIKNYPIEFILNNELIDILKEKTIISDDNLQKIFSYINKYYNNNFNISFNYPLKKYKIEILYLLFLFPISSVYIIYKYLKLKKSHNFNFQHEDFDNIYMEKNLLIIKIYLFLNSIVFFLLNKFTFNFIFFLISFIINIFIIKLYKHYIFIEKLKNINFIKRDGILYIYKYELNRLLEIINYI